MTSSIRSKSSRDHSSILKIRTAKISFTRSSVSIRQEASPSSWSLSFRSGIKKASFLLRLSAIQIGQVGCQKSRKSTSGSLVSVFNVNLQSTSRAQASVAQSSAESELYAMTQAAVESLAIKNFIQEFSSAILSTLVSIVIQTDSSAGRSMASRLGISRRSKPIELKYLWIQDEVKEGKLQQEGWSSLQSVRCSHKICSSISSRSTSSSFEILQGQFRKVKISSVISKTSSKFIPPSLSHPQHHRSRRRRCQSSCSPSTTMMLKKNFDSGSDRLQEASKEFSHLLVEGAEIKEIRVFTVIIMSLIVIQKFKTIREREQESLNQFKNQFKENQSQLFKISNLLLLRIMNLKNR